MSSAQKVKEWIDKHAAVIDPVTKSLLQKELNVEVAKTVKTTKKKVKA
jgi:hypothetical protein